MECNVNSHTHDGFNMLLSVFLFFVNKIVAIIKGGSDRKPNLILNLCEHYTMIWGHYWIFALSEWVATEHWFSVNCVQNYLNETIWLWTSVRLWLLMKEWEHFFCHSTLTVVELHVEKLIDFCHTKWTLQIYHFQGNTMYVNS